MEILYFRSKSDIIIYFIYVKGDNDFILFLDYGIL